MDEYFIEIVDHQTGKQLGAGEVGEIVVTEQAGFFEAQLEDAAEQGAVVEFAAGCADGVCAVDLLAEAGVVEVGEQGGEAGPLQSEPPAFEALSLGALEGGGDGAGRQPGQLARLAHQQFKGVGGVQDIFRKAGGQLAQLDIDLLQAHFAGGVEFGAVAAEIVQSLGEKAMAGAA